MCTGPNPVQHFLCSLAQAWFWACHRRSEHLHEVRWRPFQSFGTQGKDQSLVYMHQEILFTDDAAITASTEEDLQQLMNHFATACKDFGFTISLSKRQVMGQGMDTPPSISSTICFHCPQVHISWLCNLQ